VGGATTCSPSRETLSLFHVTGDDDFLLHVAVADTDHLRGFVLNRLLRRPEVEHVRTSAHGRGQGHSRWARSATSWSLAR
jgi:DNA-binding Lrp family transcriptional regulator